MPKFKVVARKDYTKTVEVIVEAANDLEIDECCDEIENAMANTELNEITTEIISAEEIAESAERVPAIDTGAFINRIEGNFI